MIYTELTLLKMDSPTVVTVGSFDGVHLGHHVLLQRVSDLARERRHPSVAVTFATHPRLLLDANTPARWNLNTQEEKIELLTRCGIDHVVILPFDHTMAEMSADEFVARILYDKLNCDCLVSGADHSFGKNRGGNANNIQTIANRYNIQVVKVDLRNCEEVGNFHAESSFATKISSSAIRSFLLAGDVEAANRMLGEPYSLAGEVVAGNQLGRTIGYPTANLSVSSDKLLPADGVYGVKVYIKDKVKIGMLYIGTRPAVKSANHEQRVEVNIFDLNEELYGHTIRLTPVFRVRGDIAFANLDELKNRLNKDKDYVCNHINL